MTRQGGRFAPTSTTRPSPGLQGLPLSEALDAGQGGDPLAGAQYRYVAMDLCLCPTCGSHVPAHFLQQMPATPVKGQAQRGKLDPELADEGEADAPSGSIVSHLRACLVPGAAGGPTVEASKPDPFHDDTARLTQSLSPLSPASPRALMVEASDEDSLGDAVRQQRHHTYSITYDSEGVIDGECVVWQAR